VNVDVQGTPGTENSREVQCLTGKAHEPTLSKYVPMTRATKATAKKIGG
jgi:hypothetical protein